MEPNGQTWVIMFCENYKRAILIPCERNLGDNSSECFGILQKSQQPRFWSNYFLSFQGWHLEILMHRYTSQTWPGRLIIKNDIYLNSCIEQCTVCLIWLYSSTIRLPLEYFHLCIVFVSMYCVCTLYLIWSYSSTIRLPLDTLQYSVFEGRWPPSRVNQARFYPAWIIRKR